MEDIEKQQRTLDIVDAATAMIEPSQQRQHPTAYREFVYKAAGIDHSLQELAEFMKGASDFVPPDGDDMFRTSISVTDFGQRAVLSQQIWGDQGMNNPADWSNPAPGEFRHVIESSPLPGTLTRVVVLAFESQESEYHEYVSFPRGLPSLIELLGTALDLEPRFFAETIKLLDIPQHSIDVSMLKPRDIGRFLFLSLQQDMRVGPIVSTAIYLGHTKIKDQQTPLNFVFMIMDTDIYKNMLQPTLRPSQFVEQDITRTNPSSLSFAHYLHKDLNDLSTDAINHANDNTAEYLSGILSVYETYTTYRVFRMSRLHQTWLSERETSASKDRQIYFDWQRYRLFIDSVELLITKWKSFSNNEASATFHSTSSSYNDTVRLATCLKQARILEAAVRDTLQLHVGNVTLEESRQSMRQANSIGRVTFLAFIFLPLSLVTSFFGMNLQELTGQGPKLRWFFVSAVSFTALTVICWLVWISIAHIRNRVQFEIDNASFYKRLLSIWVMSTRKCKHYRHHTTGQNLRFYWIQFPMLCCWWILKVVFFLAVKLMHYWHTTAWVNSKRREKLLGVLKRPVEYLNPSRYYGEDILHDPL